MAFLIPLGGELITSLGLVGGIEGGLGVLGSVGEITAGYEGAKLAPRIFGFTKTALTKASNYALTNPEKIGEGVTKGLQSVASFTGHSPANPTPPIKNK